MSAYGQADQIVGIGHGVSFVEVVDAPDQASLHVAPGAEIFNVQIADRQHLRSIGEIGTDLRPDLRPAVESGSQKRKYRRLHVEVFEAQVVLDQIRVMAQPILEVAGRFYDVHSARR